MKAAVVTLLTLTFTGALLSLAAPPRATPMPPFGVRHTSPLAPVGREASQWRPFWQRPNDFYIPEAFASLEPLSSSYTATATRAVLAEHRMTDFG